jgi:hypothetical protein
MTFDHVANNGEPLDFNTIPAIFSGIRAAKTLNIKDKILYYGNIKEGFLDVDIDTVLDTMTLTPIFRDMRSDELNYSFIVGPTGTPPITHQNPSTATTVKLQHNDVGGDESYDIVSDYVNYKGTQVEHLYQGYFRGETYRFGIVFFDKIGFPSFVYHLADVTFPEQYEDTYAYSRIKPDGTIVNGVPVAFAEKAWTTNNYGDYTSNPVVDGENSGAGTYSYLRIMGVEFSGIDISTIKTSISGFQIVRCKRDATILCQGLIMPCARQNDITRPLPSATQGWNDFFVPLGPASDVGDIELVGLNMLNDTQSTTNSGVTSRFLLRPNISVYYSPDTMFDPSRIPVLQTADEVALVGGCWTETNWPVGAPATSDYSQEFIQANHLVQKLYYSKNEYHLTSGSPWPQYGSTTTPTEILNVGLGGDVPDYTTGLDLNNSIEFEDQDFAGFDNGYELKGWGKETLFFTHPNFSGGSGLGNIAPLYYNSEPPASAINSPYSGYFIANYKRPNASPYGGQTLSALETNIFEATGHFQPVNNATFAAPTADVYDGVEVWGGDCYLDYFGFLRIYGRNWYEDSPPAGQGYAVDTAYGHVFPFESILNHALRQAPSEQNPIYTDVGSRSVNELYNPGATAWPDGLFYNDIVELLEEFNLNEVLLYDERLQFYNPKPLRFQENTHFPVRWRYSQQKFYGDIIDYWRVFQVNDFDDLDGQYGQITSSLFLFDNIYSWQESAFGRLRASDRALIESATAGTLTTGVGGKLDGIDYISMVSGNQHQWSLFGSGKAAYWVNVDLRKICRFAQDGYVELSDVRGLHQFAEVELPYYENSDNPVYTTGISGTFDHKNKDAKWSFVRDRKKTFTAATIVSQYSGISGEIISDDDELTHIIYTGTGITPDRLIIPVGDTSTFGNNKLMNFYIYIDNASVNDLPVYKGTTSATSWFTAVQGRYYKIWRNHLTDDFSYTDLGATEPRYKRYDTLTYSEVTDRFEMFSSYYANFYTNIKDLIISWNKDTSGQSRRFFAHDIGKFGVYYNSNSYSLLDVISSENSVITKTYDNLYVNSTRTLVDNLVKLLMYCDEQFYEMLFTGDTRPSYLENKYRMPLRGQTQEDRMRGKHLRMLFEISNNVNREVRISNLEVLNRPSPRI